MSKRLRQCYSSPTTLLNRGTSGYNLALAPCWRMVAVATPIPPTSAYYMHFLGKVCIFGTWISCIFLPCIFAYFENLARKVHILAHFAQNVHILDKSENFAYFLHIC